MNIKLLSLAIGILPLLIACGSGSDPKESTTEEPTTVSSDNIAQAITIQNAEPVTIDVPDDLTTTTDLTSSDRVIVSANSNFSLTLSAPIVENKAVAGYIIELPDGSQQLISPDTSIQEDSLVTSQSITKQLTNTSKIKKNKNHLLSNAVAESDDSGEQTTIIISGWNISDFTLDESLENLVIRILPLLVNDNIADIAELTIEQIIAAEGFEIPAVQELALAVEAVATSTIQVSLTWDTETDLDLYILEPDSTEENEKVISYYNHVSSLSLGWLDRDNTFGYGPENITFNYEMPAGDYQVAVNYYDGFVDTNYSVTIAINENDPITYTGSFLSSSSNYGDLNDENGTHMLHTITVDSSLNSKLSSKVSLNQWLGVWQLPEDATSEGYFKIEEDGITPYINYTSDDEGPISGCESYGKLTLDYLPTGFIVDGDLKVSDSFSYQYNQNATYAYKTLTKVDDSAVSECVVYSDEF